jgi:hypothetical protein
MTEVEKAPSSHKMNASSSNVGAAANPSAMESRRDSKNTTSNVNVRVNEPT